VLIPLHSAFTTEEHAAVIKKPEPGVCKIDLSTNIAETSLSIENPKKSGPRHRTSLECELEMADIQGPTTVIQNSDIPDENHIISY
jgi:hypothetical protein